MGNPRTGYYQCPRCYGRDVYESEETTGAMAMTLNTPGPVDPTIVNPIKGKVTRCRNCGEKATWYDSAETIAYKQKRDTNWSAWFGTPAGALSVFTGVWALSSDLEWSTGEKVFFWGTIVFGALIFLGGVSSISEVRATNKLKKKSQTSED